uniref:Uncharacterized protein n=1 Tax=Spongospora subterranea TaxID=70186 RepID=A0A0H5RDX5_9EUKA|eukprot:CRZ11757.1 hypothetical protein [Spongospora subterranea]
MTESIIAFVAGVLRHIGDDDSAPDYYLLLSSCSSGLCRTTSILQHYQAMYQNKPTYIISQSTTERRNDRAALEEIRSRMAQAQYKLISDCATTAQVWRNRKPFTMKQRGEIGAHILRVYRSTEEAKRDDGIPGPTCRTLS